MLQVLVCVGTSCHIKGSYDIVEKLTKAIKEYNLDEKVALAGGLCIGQCNREGVTIQVNDEIFTVITVEKFDTFCKVHLLDKI